WTVTLTLQKQYSADADIGINDIS
ncbi:hypothetical protein EVA_02017, partial [gut metagenome]